MAPIPATPAPEPEIKQEPVENISPPAPTKVNEPPRVKLPMALRKLHSDLDGKAWECTDTHRPRLRVRTTGIDESDEYLDHWDNTIPAKEEETVEEE